MNKTTCPLSRPEFLSHAKPLECVVNGVPHVMMAREFGTGSMGWYESGKQTVVINGKACVCQVGITVTLVGSKDVAGAQVVAKVA